MTITKTQEIEFFREQAREDLLSFAVFNDKFFQVVKIHEIMANAMMKVES